MTNPPMKLQAFLDRTGHSKADVARFFGITRSAVSCWGDVPKARVEALQRVQLAFNHDAMLSLTPDTDEYRHVGTLRWGRL